jgi:hypothetical protein
MALKLRIFRDFLNILYEGGIVLLPILFVTIIVASVILAFVRKKPFMLAVPFVAIFGYMVIQIAMVPLGFMETLSFIFGLR